MADPTEELKKIHEVAQYYRVDDTTVRRWIKNGALEAVTLPRRGTRQVYRLKPSAIRKFDPDFKG